MFYQLQLKRNKTNKPWFTKEPPTSCLLDILTDKVNLRSTPDSSRGEAAAAGGRGGGGPGLHQPGACVRSCSGSSSVLLPPVTSPRGHVLGATGLRVRRHAPPGTERRSGEVWTLPTGPRLSARVSPRLCGPTS